MEKLKNGIYTPKEFYEICENANIDLCKYLECQMDYKVIEEFETNGNRQLTKSYNYIGDKIVIRVYNQYKNCDDEDDVKFIVTDNTKDFEEI